MVQRLVRGALVARRDRVVEAERVPGVRVLRLEPRRLLVPRDGRRLLPGGVGRDGERLERGGRERVRAVARARRRRPRASSRPGRSRRASARPSRSASAGSDEHERRPRRRRRRPRPCPARRHGRIAGGRPRREQRAERDERGRGHGEEVEVVVDERVDGVGERDAGERGRSRGRSARSTSRSARRTPTTAAAASEPEPQADDAGSASSWSGTLCGSLTAVASSRYRRRAISNVPAPDPPTGRSAATSSASPHHARRLLAHRSVSRPGSLAHSPPRDLRRRPAIGSPTDGDERRPRRDGADARDARSTVRAAAPLLRRRGGRAGPDARCHGERADDREHREHAAVGDAVGAQGPVLDERRPRERPAARRAAPGVANSATASASIEPLVGQDEPEHRARATAPTTPARDWVSRSARTRAVEEQRAAEAGRRAPPAREPTARARAQRRRAARERSSSRRAPGAARSGPLSAKSEGIATPSSAQPSAAPDTIASAAATRARPPRPPRRAGRARERRGRRARGRAIPTTGRRRSTRRRRAPPRRSAPAAAATARPPARSSRGYATTPPKRRRDADRPLRQRARRARPVASARAPRSSAARTPRRRERTERREDDGLRARPAAARSRGRVHDAARLAWPRRAKARGQLPPNGVLHIVYPSLIADPRWAGTLMRSRPIRQSS